MEGTDGFTAFCRDCLATVAPTARRCPACGSPRLVRHRELSSLHIAHIDCDAFYASVEKRDDPSLRDRPVIIGGGKRGVVSTACYIARLSGVRSAMPMFKALELCPEAVVIPPDMEKYVRVGRQVRERMLALTPLVEPLSIDEAFLDLAGTERLHQAPPAVVLARFARDIERDIGISVSVGLAANKFLAKVASGMRKPNGLTVIPPDKAAQFVAGLPVRKFFGVGQATERKMQEAGISTGADLLQFSQDELCRLFGKNGLFFYSIARGIDHRTVQAHRVRKSIGTETTLAKDILAIEMVQQVLQGLTTELAADLAARKACGRTLTLKVRYHDFSTISRSCTVAAGFAGVDDVEMQLPRLLAATEAGKRPIRLLGISVSNLLSEKDLVRRAYQLPLPFPDDGWAYQWKKSGW